jgi:hypothetical protein
LLVPVLAIGLLAALLGAVVVLPQGSTALAATPAKENGPLAKPVAERLGLPKKNHCGDEVARVEMFPGDSGEEVFALTRTWHHVRKCLLDILAVARGQPAGAPIHSFLMRQVFYVLSQPPVRFYRSGEEERLVIGDVTTGGGYDWSRFDRIVYTNAHGVAHNAMSQSQMASWLFAAARILAEAGDTRQAAVFEGLGEAVMRVALDPLDRGGLRSGGACDLRPELGCSWFHAVTSPNRRTPGEGGTLNKHLLVILGLDRAAGDLLAIDKIEPGDRRRQSARDFATAAIEGIHQLVYSSGRRRGEGAAPSLFDFIARDESGAPILRSWLYYGMNPKREGPGYFMRDELVWKNCNYHILDMSLLYRNLTGPGAETDLSGFTIHDPWLKDSLLGFILKAYEIKLAEGIRKDSETTKGGDYHGCGPYNEEGFEKVVSYFREVTQPGD